MKVPAFNVGDQVKLNGIPTPVEGDRERFPETFALFQKAVGRTFRVRGFGEYGHAELWLREDGSENENGGVNSIWVEPEHLTHFERK
jgi:hypothetical protein